MAETGNKRKKLADEVHRVLEKMYPEADISLTFSNPLELLVATMLSAQCTDERVNGVTERLFTKYRKAADFAFVDQEQLEEDIRSTGFYRNKAKSIKSVCTDIVDRFDGEVPGSMDELTSLRGVGRKTANVALGNVFGVPAVIVDTHVTRVSQRLGLSSAKNPEAIERDLMEILPVKNWTKFCNRMILFGRNQCKARKPACGKCPLLKKCQWEQKSNFS